MPTVIVQNEGPVTLSDTTHLKAQGGEGSVYVRGDVVYKLWEDPSRMPSLAKIQELQILSSDPDIIIPKNLILDKRSKPIGLTMRFVDEAHVLAQSFPKAFRDRSRLTPEKTVDRVTNFQGKLMFVHSKDGVLIVDLNEMNFMESSDFSRIYFIDTTTYKTRSFPPTALMESVRDRHTSGFSKETDYFSFAVVTFQMFIGIHPYRGKYPPVDSVVPKDERMEARMQQNISVFHKGVSIPGACLPFSVVPQVYLDWYEAVFERGKRIAPPEGLHAVIRVAEPVVYKMQGDSRFDVTLYFQYDDDVLSFYKDVVVTKKSVYSSGRKIGPVLTGVQIGVTPQMSHVIAASLENHELKLFDMTTGKPLDQIPMLVDAVMSYDGRILFQSGDSLMEVSFIERQAKTIAGTELVCNVMPKATQLFEGVAIQRMLKAYFAVVSPERGMSYSVKLEELNGYRVVDAKFSKRVLIVVGIKGGKYDKFIYKFADDYQTHALRTISDIGYNGINFTVREDGMCLHMNEDELEVFKNVNDSDQLVSVTDPALNGAVRLLHSGTQSMFAVQNKIYKFSAKK